MAIRDRTRKRLIGAAVLFVYIAFPVYSIIESNFMPTIIGGFLIVMGIPLFLVGLFYSLERVGFLPRPVPRTRCQQCEYLLTGNASGVCPECGVSIPVEQQLAIQIDPVDDPNEPQL